MFGFFNVGVGHHVEFYRNSDRHLEMYAIYDAHITNEQEALRQVMIRAPAPIHEGIIPDNAFALVLGPVCIRGERQHSIIDANQMEVIPAEAGPPLSDDVDLFPAFPASYIIGVGNRAGPHYRLPDGKFAFPVAMAEFVRGRSRSFRLTYVSDQSAR